jgi:uncharacterized protein (DUF2062 family)
MRRRLRRFLNLLLKIEDTPRRTALAFGIGVWIAFFPVLGTHTAMAFGIAVAFRLNRLALLLGAYVNNPWTITPLYMAGTALGCALLGVPTSELVAPDFGLSGRAFYEAALLRLRPFVLPFLLGNIALGIVAGYGAYLAVRRVLEGSGSAPASPSPAEP